MKRPDIGIMRASCPEPVMEYIVWLEHQLGECYKHAGGDPSGGLKGETDEDWRLAPHALDEVKELREGYSKAIEVLGLQDRNLSNKQERLDIYTGSMIIIEGRPYTCSKDLAAAVKKLQTRLLSWEGDEFDGEKRVLDDDMEEP